MSKKISYKGMLAPGTQEKIRLRTLKGKIGYKITKFQLISSLPGTTDYEFVGKITKIEDPSIVATIDFTDSKLMAVAYHKANPNADRSATTDIIIFDNEVTNQDIFVSIADAAAGSTECNYYIELESMTLNDLQATEITLRNIRQMTSPGAV